MQVDILNKIIGQVQIIFCKIRQRLTRDFTEEFDKPVQDSAEIKPAISMISKKTSNLHTQ